MSTKPNPIMTYEGWRTTFQSSELAARSAYSDFMNLWIQHKELQTRFNELQAENENFGLIEGHDGEQAKGESK